MINYNIPNSELLSYMHGQYNDNKLMQKHTRSRIYEYIRKHLTDNCLDFEKRICLKDLKITDYTNDILINIESYRYLTDTEVENFCQEFGIILYELKIILKNNSKPLFKKDDNNGEDRLDNGYLIYCFKREKEQWLI